MKALAQSGRARTGLVVFVFLLGLVVGQFTYRYLTRSNRLNDEAVELMNQDKYDSALEKLDQALAIEPHHVRANFHRGICLFERHRFDEALESFDLVSRLEPKEPRAHFRKGKILWFQRQFEQAIQALERAVELKPEYPDAWIILAECHYEIYLRQMAAAPETTGSPARAVAAFKNYLKQRPAAPDRHIVERKLEILAHAERYPEVLEKRRQQMEAGGADSTRAGPRDE
ncbi:MAG: tetratricopeptide repeat protein [Deltaproteobacteria bacterium]|nr:tetratricopeptide repeat protein [Deltaproteobacteria bacterium]